MMLVTVGQPTMATVLLAPLVMARHPAASTLVYHDWHNICGVKSWAKTHSTKPGQSSIKLCNKSLVALREPSPEEKDTDRPEAEEAIGVPGLAEADVDDERWDDCVRRFPPEALVAFGWI